MKLLLAISVGLNLLLGILYFQQKNKPPLERIIIEHKKEEKKITPNKLEALTPYARKNLKVTPKKPDPAASPGPELDPIIAMDEDSFQRAAEEMEITRREFLDKLELPEGVMAEKEKLLEQYYAQSEAIHKKHPAGITMSFAERRQLIELEEKLHQKLEELYGKKNWQRYKQFVDSYNQKIMQQQKPGEPSGLMMGY